MPKPTPRKVAGKVTPPPSQAEFDKIRLGNYCVLARGVLHRLHTINPKTNKPWPPIHFSTRGNTRFDPVHGLGSLCLGHTLAGALMEKFDDYWGPVGDIGRSITEQELKETWDTLVYLPEVNLFDATGANLSKIGADAQLFTGEYAITREWALRLMFHPDQVAGILFPSRHDPKRQNIALFGRPTFSKPRFDPNLLVPNIFHWTPNPGDEDQLIFGPEGVLQHHSQLMAALAELEVGILP